jgi:hypothetical protein
LQGLPRSAARLRKKLFRENVQDGIRHLHESLSRAQPLTKKIKKPKATWLTAKLLVGVEYRALTGDGKVRHSAAVTLIQGARTIGRARGLNGRLWLSFRAHPCPIARSAKTERAEAAPETIRRQASRRP